MTSRLQKLEVSDGRTEAGWRAKERREQSGGESREREVESERGPRGSRVEVRAIGDIE